MDEIDDLYRDQILDHYKNPRNKGAAVALEGATQIHAHAANAGCGDLIDLTLTMKDGVVHSIVWEGTGCAISQASMSVISEWMTGKPLRVITGLDRESVYGLLGLTQLSPTREKCLLLP